MNYQPTRTNLGFRDISNCLKDESFDDLRKFDVMMGIMIDNEIQQTHDNGEKSLIYYFRADYYNMRGRIFPRDEIVKKGNVYDIIILERGLDNTKFKYNVDVNIYHDFNIGERFPVKISRTQEDKDPSFKLLNNFPGFLKRKSNLLCNEIQKGDLVLAEVSRVINRNGKIAIEFSLIKKLEKK